MVFTSYPIKLKKKIDKEEGNDKTKRRSFTFPFIDIGSRNCSCCPSSVKLFLFFYHPLTFYEVHGQFLILRKDVSLIFPRLNKVFLTEINREESLPRKLSKKRPVLPTP